MENENVEDNEMNYKRALIYLERKSIVHASLKNGQFYNGRLFSVVFDFFEIHDRITGIQLVFFSELKKPLQEFTSEKEKNEKEVSG